MLTREEYMEKVNGFFPESDEKSLERIEFFTDFYDNTSKEFEEVKKENGKEEVEIWKKKYRDRFFSGGEDTTKPTEETEKKSFESIFKEVED